MEQEPRSLQEAVLYFADPANCRKFLVARRWPDGVTCPTCGSAKVVFSEKHNRWQCGSHHVKRQFTSKTGTIFEDSPIGLDKWLIAMWLIVNCKNGVSSYEIQRALGITQKTAWFLDHRIRMALHSGTIEKLSGEVEVDESFIGGKARNMHAARRARKITGTGGKDKTIVMGMMERGGNVRTIVIDNRRKHEVQKQVREHVEAGSAIFSDELKSYEGLQADYQHAVINHAVEYVNGNVHTNNCENFWSLLKRGLHGTYVSVEPFHLFRYLDEQAYRFNNRKMNDAERFDLAVRQVVGKRLTWDQLTGKESEIPPPTIN
ncbi:MAG: IS1595 family transposase [Acidobacteriaceae bacterium]|nr:IS1595 family transposase [Acidobacteriaceae bacterium]